jgi:glutathione reductase (NADPH)
VTTAKNGTIITDEYQNTNIRNVYAVGDVTGRLALTPVAIAAGRRLADRLFNNMVYAKADYENVPSVVFSRPPIATCGLTEPAAVTAFGVDNIKIFTSNFVNLYYDIFSTDDTDITIKPISKYKLICAGPEEKVVGLHLIGRLIRCR